MSDINLTFIWGGSPIGEFYLSPSTDLGTLRALLSGYLPVDNVPAEFVLIARPNGEPLVGTERTSLAELRLSSGDFLTVSDARSPSALGGAAGGGSTGASGAIAKMLRHMKRSAPRALLDPSSLKTYTVDQMIDARASPDDWYAAMKVNPGLRASVSRDVELSSAASADTAGPLRDLFLRRGMDSALPDVNHYVALRDAEMRLLRNPLDTAAQRVLESEITRQNVAANRELAMDVMPESFIRLDMLRVRLTVHGVDCVGMVDTGAQMTIISKRTATKCGIMRLVDTRESGIATGVGTGKIVGKVHAVDIKLGGEGITASFTVMEKDDMEFLIGLDLLRRFGAIVDLPRNVLVLNLGSKKIEVPFLTSMELAALPESPRNASASAGGGGPLAGDQSARGHTASSPPPVPSSSSAAPGLPRFDLSGILPPASTSASLPASDDVNALIAAGFSREVAISALAAANGDVDAALARLLEEQ